MDSVNAIELEDSISHRNHQTNGNNQTQGARRQSAYEAQRNSLNGNLGLQPNGTIPQTQSTNMARSSTHEVPDQQNQSFEFARQSLISSPHSSRTVFQIQFKQSLAQLMTLLQNSSQDRIFAQLIKSIQDEQEEHAKKILEHIASLRVSIVSIMDPKRSNVIHMACMKKLVSLVKAFITYERSLGTNVRPWLNERNMDFFAPVHYAAFAGSIQILDILKENGADLRITNQLGQNALCVAAQGDQVSAMLWLQINGLSFLDTDEKGGSPLHWATYYGSEHAVAFLLAWICKQNQRQIINLQDQEGQAPLHLAAMTGNMRIAKKLLLRGGNKKLREKMQQQTPAEVAKDNNFDQLHDFLDSANCLMEFFNLKTSFKPISFNWEQMITFFIVYFYCLGATIVFVYPFFNNDHIYQYVSMFLFGLGIVFYFLTWLVSPGYIKVNTDQQLLFDLLSQTEPWEICAECQIKKPKRSRHCEICKRCVAVFDHHCPWVNNCIGANNHLIFVIFLVTIVVNLIHVIVLNGMYIYRDYEEPNSFYTWFNNFYSSHTLYVVKVVCQSLVLVLSLFIIPVTLLLRLHLDNIFSNKTTFEKNKEDANAIKTPSVTTLSTSTQSQPKKRLKPWSVSNCTAMCCRNKYNKEYYN